MDNQIFSPDNSLNLTIKGKHFQKEKETIFLFLQDHVATAAMSSKATGIPHKNICRYKRDLEKAKVLFEVHKKLCRVTGFMAWYLTTNIKLVQNQERCNNDAR